MSAAAHLSIIDVSPAVPVAPGIVALIKNIASSAPANPMPDEDGAIINVDTPSTGEIIGTVLRCGGVEMRRAIEAASAAWEGRRSLTPKAEHCFWLGMSLFRSTKRIWPVCCPLSKANPWPKR